MANRFGLKILPINKQKQLMVPDLPGLLAASPPRRSARRRSQEELILYLKIAGNAPLSESASNQLLEKLAEVFFKTDGSTTSAMRNTADVLNKYLLDRNMRAASRGLRGVGMFTQIVLRDNRMLLAQCGESHLHFIQSGSVEHLYDPELSGSGLGVSKLYKVRYHQLGITPDQLLILSSEPPPSWAGNALKNLPKMNLDAVMERLLHRVQGNIEAAVIVPRPGRRGIDILSSPHDDDLSPEKAEALEATQEEDFRPSSVISAVKEAVSPVREYQPEPEPDLKPEKSISEQLPDENQGLKVPAMAREEPVPAPGYPEIREMGGDFSAPEEQLSAGQKEGKPKPADLVHKLRESQIVPAFQTAAASVGRGLQTISKWFRDLIGRALPDDQLLDLPGWSMGVIAVLVPLIVVTVGSIFYIKRGRDRLYEDHYNAAQTLLTEALLTDDEGMYYQLISGALGEIKTAKNYRETEEIKEMYDSTRSELDSLDRINRLDFQPLFNRGLGPDVTISEIVVTPWNDLYLLNEDDGTVIWAQSNPDGYQIKNGFSCGPIEGHVSVGPLEDITALPTNQDDQASVLGIDQSHKMMFCYNDLEEPPVIFEDTSYTLGRGPVRAVTVASSSPYNLYILDPEKRAIWIEYESENYHEGSEYFGAIDAPEMEDAVDLATNGSELYILHEDGYITRCITESATADPQCESPAEFTDDRPGKDNGPFIQDAVFNSFVVKSSPGTALYMLDKEQLAVYRFSTQLAFQEQFRPEEGFFNQEATAFAVTMSDRLFLALDDQVYTAQMMP